MQQNMIQSVQRLLLSTSSNPVVDWNTLLEISDHSRLDSISALAQLYQRFSTSAPIRRSTLSWQSSVSAPDFCAGALELQNGPPGSPASFGPWRCSSCNVRVTESLPAIWRPNAGDQWISLKGMAYIFAYAQHVPSTFGGIGPEHYSQCIICWNKLGIVSKTMAGDEWRLHVRHHLTIDGYKLCTNRDGNQIHKSFCKTPGCEKIHSKG